MLDEPDFPPALEPEKSASAERLGTEKDGIPILLEDKRIQVLELSTKKRILELFMVSGAFKPQSFDAVMTAEPAPQLTIDNIDEHFSQLTLVEMKTTRKAIKDAALNGFFFGATDNEFQMAKALKDRYVFAFVIINDNNDYGRPFFVLLTLEQLHARTHASRVQYQINFRSNMPADDPALPNAGIGPMLQAP